MTGLTFKDYFSGHAAAYADARPRYPAELFDWLATLTRNHETAWDCATGNGQAARGLAEHFKQVIATDPSREQIENAFPHERVSYRVALAESPGLESRSVDLVTVAQAVHWFDRPAFYAQVRQALKPGGVIAIWCYGLCAITPEIDALVQNFYTRETGPYWPPERALIDDGYRSINFPFTEITPPALHIEQRWTLSQFLAYLRTWSAVQKYITRNGRDPVIGFGAELETRWGDPGAIRTVRWPLHIRAGRLPRSRQRAYR
ncbi:MAG: class I SAM-dependent methyltransferase [Gammaproteobacteria bacterium]